MTIINNEKNRMGLAYKVKLKQIIALTCHANLGTQLYNADKENNNYVHLVA